MEKSKFGWALLVISFISAFLIFIIIGAIWPADESPDEAAIVCGFLMPSIVYFGNRIK